MRTVRVHSLAQVRAALTAARSAVLPVRLLSPAALPAGLAWWRAVVAAARIDFPDVAFDAVVDCGPSAGLALATVRAGLGPLAADVPADVRDKLRDIAGQAGTCLVDYACLVESARPADHIPHPLDLCGVTDAEAVCRHWLAVGTPPP